LSPPITPHSPRIQIFGYGEAPDKEIAAQGDTPNAPPTNSLSPCSARKFSFTKRTEQEHQDKHSFSPTPRSRNASVKTPPSAGPFNLQSPSHQKGHFLPSPPKSPKGTRGRVSRFTRGHTSGKDGNSPIKKIQRQILPNLPPALRKTSRDSVKKLVFDFTY